MPHNLEVVLGIGDLNTMDKKAEGGDMHKKQYKENSRD